MTTPETTYNSTGNSVNGNYNSNFIDPTSTNQPGQVQGSSYAAMASAVFQIASLMTLLNISYNQVAVQETQFQAKFNNQQRQATLDEGHAQAMQQWMQMGSSIAGAAASIGAIVGPSVANRMGGENSLYKQRAAAQNELTGLQKQRGALDEGVKKVGPQGISAEDEGLVMADMADEASVRSINPEEGDDVVEARSAVEGGLSIEDEEAIAEAAEGANPKERAAMQKELDGKIDNAQQKLNYIQNRISSNENTGRFGAELFKEGANSVFHAVQAVYVEKAAEHRATGLSAQFNQQTDEKNAQTMLRWMAENYSYLSSVLQALGQVAASAA